MDAALGHVRDHRRHQGVAEALCDAPGQHMGAHVVLAQHHVRAVLLGAADGHEHGRRAVRDARLDLGRGQFVEVDAALRMRGTRRDQHCGRKPSPHVCCHRFQCTQCTVAITLLCRRRMPRHTPNAISGIEIATTSSGCRFTPASRKPLAR